MKAKLKKTGEIINIAEYDMVKLDKCDSYGNPIEIPYEDVEQFYDDKGVPLGMLIVFPSVIESNFSIDWEQRRYEIANYIETNRSGKPNSSKKEEDNEKKMVQFKGEGGIIELDTILEYRNGQVYIKKMNTNGMPVTLTFNLIEALSKTIVEYYKKEV